VVGLGRVELPTSPLSGVRSNQLSYRPVTHEPAGTVGRGLCNSTVHRARYRSSNLCWALAASASVVLLKEVIQPHVPVRLPCYDFTPVIDHTVGGAPLAVKLPTSGAINFHGVTGGVYKTRERIHRDVADSRLLAIPTSRSRVADSDPDYDRLSGIGSPSRVGSPLYRPL
jgi:hypothetical protein